MVHLCMWITFGCVIEYKVLKMHTQYRKGEKLVLCKILNNNIHHVCQLHRRNKNAIPAFHDLGLIWPHFSRVLQGIRGKVSFIQVHKVWTFISTGKLLIFHEIVIFSDILSLSHTLFAHVHSIKVNTAVFCTSTCYRHTRDLAQVPARTKFCNT